MPAVPGTCSLTLEGNQTSSDIYGRIHSLEFTLFGAMCRWCVSALTTHVLLFIQLWANSKLYAIRMSLLQGLILSGTRQLQRLACSFANQSVTHCIVRNSFLVQSCLARICLYSFTFSTSTVIFTWCPSVITAIAESPWKLLHSFSTKQRRDPR